MSQFPIRPEVAARNKRRAEERLGYVLARVEDGSTPIRAAGAPSAAMQFSLVRERRAADRMERRLSGGAA
jgi:hypothetical protein